jgi:hydroxymethylglutaryl-CoA lyase
LTSARATSILKSTRKNIVLSYEIYTVNASPLPPPDVLISEVGPRDGLQSIARVMPTADKLRWIDALHAAGLREIEVGSFVPARLLPQMADVAEVVAHALTLPGLTVMALVPNGRGAEAALAAGVHKLTLPVSASTAHSLANVRKTPLEMIDALREIAARRDEIARGSRPASRRPSAARWKARCPRTR